MKIFCALVCVTMISVCANRARSAPLANGDFEAHPTDLAGWIVDGEVRVVSLPEDMNRVAHIQENPAGAFSRFYQEFDLPDDPACLSFKFLMVASPFNCPQNDAEGSPAQGQTAPDAFLVFLITPDTFERLVVPADCEPTFSQAFFWMDNDDQTPPQFCDELGLVGATEISTVDFNTVSLDVSSLAGGQTVRIEFAMVDGCDGRNTQIIVDDVIVTSVGEPSNCTLSPPVPAVSSWGVLITGLLVVVAGSCVFRRAW